jgi:hypothetical protein
LREKWNRDQIAGYPASVPLFNSIFNQGCIYH